MHGYTRELVHICAMRKDAVSESSNAVSRAVRNGNNGKTGLIITIS